jgi:hypothetical protein
MTMTTATSGCARCGRAEIDGQACACCPKCGGVKSANARQCYACAWPGRAPRSTTRQAPPDVEQPVVVSRQRRSVRYRVYCFACGRSTEVESALRQTNRCAACGGTMLVEVGDND